MLFQKSLQDLIKFSKCSSDPQGFLNSCISEIKTELKSQEIKLRMEDYDIRWANFDILQLMSSQSFTPKHLAYTTASITFDYASDCIMMTTNLFKKELKNPSYIECSVMLSCLTNICTKEIAVEVIDLVMSLQNHTKPVIRKKSAALLGKIFRVAPELIPNNLEKILQRINNNEENAGVLTGYINVMSVVLQINEKLYPLLIKPLYELLEKQKNNWLIIKIIKLFDRILRLEPRMIKKLVEPYTKMLRGTTAKSIEFELLSTIIRHFQEHKQIYSLACENLKSFINHTDANLRSLGLACLKSMLYNSKEMLVDYKDYLLESLKKADFPTKKQILEIFQLFVQKDLLEDIVTQLLQFLEENPLKPVEDALKDCIIDTILKACKKENFIHVDDFEWLLFEVLGKLMRKVPSVSLAKELSSTVMTLILRVDDLKACIHKFCVNTLMGFDEIAAEHQPFSEIRVNIQGFSEKKADISAKEVIFQTLVFLAGEYTGQCRVPSEFFAIFEFFNNENLLFLYPHSFHFVKVAAFKLAVGLCVLLKDSSAEKVRGSLEKMPGFSGGSLQNDVVSHAFAKVLAHCAGIQQKMLKIHRVSTYDHTSSNALLGLLFSFIGLELRNLVGLEPEQLEKALLEASSKENLEKFADIRDLLDCELRPVHPDAQKYVKLPEGLDIQAGSIEIHAKELELVNETKKELDLEESSQEIKGEKKKKSKKDKKIQENKEEVKENIEETAEAQGKEGGNENTEKNEDVEREDEKEIENLKEKKIKKEYKLNVEDYLPPGVSLEKEAGAKGAETKKKKKKEKKEEPKAEEK